MKLNSKIIAISIFIIIFGGVGLAKLAGVWKTTSTKIPRKITEGKSSGQLNPNDIKGSYTFKDVVNNFNIPEEDLTESFLIDKNQIDTFKCKDLEANFIDTQGKDIGTGAVRAFVAFYKGIDVDLTEEAYLPKQAVEIILKNGKPTEKQIEYMKTHSVEVKK
ncbi:hypothetical protein SAMN05443428_103118 [Caloramator quimbayensis]|uniref:Uncharacterized protein n=1 Tax=Caloramator quimbayensis TaxID=1147123 RepID=A0A1T4WQZ1_9CLOT|nr:hypothetical protein [Caloramator quimbayensis]SKA79736.1 hypothetical protein SAMN05443428_103118 [Caloramator quimbayensis]